MKIENRKISELIPYANNAKKHDKKQVDNVAESLRQYGWVQPVVVDRDGVVVIGHCRLLAAKKLRMKEAPCVCVDDLTPEQVNALRIVDNKTNESEWDMQLLSGELENVDLSMFDFDFDLKEEKEENPYTMNENAPVYEIQGICPKLEDLCDRKKTNALLRKIEAAQIPEDVKRFLRVAAHRHTRFDYGKIAEYYANAEKEVQELFEESALVIIDYDAAIKNGFTKLSKRIREMRDEG